MITEAMSCSRRSLSVFLIAGLLISSYVIYDYDSKLRVLMLSNSDYRRMTDSLNNRVETFRAEMKEIRATHDVVISERDATIRRMREDSQLLDRALSEEKKMKESEDAQLEQLSQSHQRQINELNNLRSQLDSLSQESQKLHHCQGQYDALLRMYHSLSDSYQELQDSSPDNKETSRLSSSQSLNNNAGVLQPAMKPGSSSSSSSLSPKQNLVKPSDSGGQQQQPLHNASSSTTPKGSSSAHVDMPGAPVGVEPPAASKVRSLGVQKVVNEVVESPLQGKKQQQRQQNADLNYFDHGDDLNEDFSDDPDYDGYKKMNLQHPLLDKERDDVVFHIQQNYHKKPVVINSVLYDDEGQRH